MAADLFRTKGFDGTTLDDISKATGVSRFKLYAWFGSKEGILRAAFNATWAQINEKVTAKLTAEMTLRQTFEIVLSVILDFAERRDPIAALFLEFSRRHGVDGQLQPEVLRFSRILEDSIRRAIGRGEIHPSSLRCSEASCSRPGRGSCIRLIWVRTDRVLSPDLTSRRSRRHSCDSWSRSSARRVISGAHVGDRGALEGTGCCQSGAFAGSANQVL
jgi:AcrR family transcriptional regulator